MAVLIIFVDQEPLPSNKVDSNAPHPAALGAEVKTCRLEIRVIRVDSSRFESGLACTGAYYTVLGSVGRGFWVGNDKCCVDYSL